MTTQNARYELVKHILEEEFPDVYWRYHEKGLLETELQNMVERSTEVFEEMGVDEDNRMLVYAITGTIAEYLEGQQG